MMTKEPKADFKKDTQQFSESELETIRDKFIEGEIKSDNLRLPYRLFSPKTEEGKLYPLVIYLHGAGERGTDTRLVLKNSGAINFAHPDWQKKHPCYVFAPQCPEDSRWIEPEHVKCILEAVHTLPQSHAIDRKRIYLTGLSMGGFGTWNLISLHPELFAAAMPICGGGDPKAVLAAKDVPVWAFHAADDPVVSVDGLQDSLGYQGFYGTRRVMTALRSTGNPDVRYTEYPSGYMENSWGAHPHASWEPAYANIEALEWLFSKSLDARYKIEWIMPGLWHISDYANSSFYLVEGSEKALVIDTGMGGGDVPALIRSLTSLPFELAVTHVHGDHMFHTDKFGKFYMSRKEEPIMGQYIAMMMPGSKTTAADIIDIKDGDVFDLGDGVVIEVIELSGHTPGSVAFLDRSRGVCFTGDAVGGGVGVWMQTPGALNLSEFKVNLEGFLKRVSGLGLEGLWFLGGHRNQEWIGLTPSETYNPITREMIGDMAELCQLIIDKDVEIVESEFSFMGKQAYSAVHGTAKILFSEDNAK